MCANAHLLFHLYGSTWCKDNGVCVCMLTNVFHFCCSSSSSFQFFRLTASSAHIIFATITEPAHEICIVLLKHLLRKENINFNMQIVESAATIGTINKYSDRRRWVHAAFKLIPINANQNTHSLRLAHHRPNKTGQKFRSRFLMD